MAASYFGEVLPEFSRIVTDDEDETVDIKNKWEVILKWNPVIREEIKSGGHVDCQSLIIGDQVIACTFLRDNLISPNSKPIGVISCGPDVKVQNTIGQQSAEDNACFLYTVVVPGHKSLVVLWNLSASPVQQFTVVQKLMADMPSNLEVVILTSAHLSTYKCPDPGRFSDTQIVRSLECDITKGPLPFPVLEVPNMVTGFPASVLTECQTRNIPARLHIAFVEETTPDSTNIGAFQSLLNTSPFSHLIKGSLSDKRSSRSNQKPSNTNLYS